MVDFSGLLAQVAQLEAKNKRQDDEFNAQRARLKEMFLQKECK